MSTWHVWGDYIHTRPARIGSARMISDGDDEARQTADAHGFQFDLRMRRGFEPWSAIFSADDDEGQEYAFAQCPVVRGWQRIG